MTASACPDRDTLARLAQGELDGDRSDDVYLHLRVCDACCSTLEGLSPGWSRATPAECLSTRTRDVRDRLAASPPSMSDDGGRSAAIPPAIPVIPGLGPLEPRSRGGMGIVYRADDLALERPVAVKVLWPTAAGSQNAWARAKREALLLARISHANVVAVYTAGETGGSPFLVMEWVDGPSLQQRMDAGLPTPRQAARLARDLARALEAVHALGIIHRDIKPDNVLLASPEAAAWDDCIPKLADFGLARPAEVSQHLTQDAAALGTPAYMAPEQTGLAPDLGPVGPAADIHALGGLVFALLAGSPPHEAETAAAALQRAAQSEITWPPECRRLPRDLRAIVEKCLEREPARRYASAAVLAEDLHRFVEGLPVRARPVSPLRRLARGIRRRPVLAAAVGLSVLFATAGIGGFAYHTATVAAANSRIDQSERLAEETAGVATRSMSRLTGDLVEQMILRSRPDDTGHVEFLRQIRDEFANWPLGDNPFEALQFRITGLGRVAGLFFDVSHHQEALACHELTLDMLDDLEARRPGHPQVMSQRLLSLHLQRACLYHLGRVDEAVASARHSVALLEQASGLLPEHEQARELVRATLDLGMFLHEQHEYEKGSARLEEALTLMRKLREARPEEIILLQQEAHALFSAQYATFKAGQFHDCRRWLDRLVDEVGRFLASPQAAVLVDGQRSHLTKMVGIGFKQLSQLDLQEGRTAEALAHNEQRRQVCLDFLHRLPPDQIDPVHRELVDAELQAAKILIDCGRASEAEAAVDRAGRTAAELLERQPGVWDHAALEATVCQQRAELAAARGDAPLATQGFRRVIELMTPQLAKPACQAEAGVKIAAAEAALDALETGSTADTISPPAVLTSQP
jgi:tetratricopeptide (TPR) repeat protein